jgi:hypothetical protein
MPRCCVLAKYYDHCELREQKEPKKIDQKKAAIEMCI